MISATYFQRVKNIICMFIYISISNISYLGIIHLYEKIDSKVFRNVESSEGFTDLVCTILSVFLWF